jgi:hypothetical protein
MYEHFQNLTWAHLHVLMILEKVENDEDFLRAAQQLRHIALAYQRDGDLDASELLYAYAQNLVRMVQEVPTVRI